MAGSFVRDLTAVGSVDLDWLLNLWFLDGRFVNAAQIPLSHVV